MPDHMSLSAKEIVDRLRLSPHPEGGWYRQTWAAAPPPEAPDARPAGTAIYYLLAEGQKSHWHRVDSTEIWHFYGGAPLDLRMARTAAGPAELVCLGPNLSAGEVPQAIVPAGHWQAARSTGAWSLVGCTVSPGFRFDGFELAPPDFDIPDG